MSELMLRQITRIISKIKRSRKIGFGEITIIVVLILLSSIMLYPFLHALAYSLSDSLAAMTRTITVFPIHLTLDNYKLVLGNKLLLNSFFISVVRTLSGITYSILITGFAAYAISKKFLPGKKLFVLFLIIPMYFSGGLLPLYILLYKMSLFDTFLVYILPHGFWGFNMLLMRTFYEGIPDSLEESAKMEGANDFYIYFKIIFPLSMPVVATIAMFNGVWHWNQWFDAILYITKEGLLPMQSILQRLLQESLATRLLAEQGIFSTMQSSSTLSPEAIKMAALIITTVPIIVIYPFLQRYFIKGAVIGAVKG